MAILPTIALFTGLTNMAKPFFLMGGATGGAAMKTNCGAGVGTTVDHGFPYQVKSLHDDEDNILMVEEGLSRRVVVQAFGHKSLYLISLHDGPFIEVVCIRLCSQVPCT